MSVPPAPSGPALPAALLLPLPPAPGRPAAHAPRAEDRVALSPAFALKQLETLLPVLQDALRRAPTGAAAVPLGHLARAVGQAARLLAPNPATEPAAPPHTAAVLMLRDAASLLRRAEASLQDPAPTSLPEAPASTVAPDAPDRLWALTQTVAANNEIDRVLAQLGEPGGARPRARVPQPAATSMPALPSALTALGLLLFCLVLLLLAGAWTAAATFGGAVSLLWLSRRLRIELNR